MKIKSNYEIIRTCTAAQNWLDLRLLAGSRFSYLPKNTYGAFLMGRLNILCPVLNIIGTQVPRCSLLHVYDLYFFIDFKFIL